MSLYVSEKVGNEIVLKKYAPAVPVYRGFWAVTIGGFAGTLVECNGSMRYIGSNEKTIYQIVEPGTYTFTATRHGETKSKTIVLDDKDPNNSYTVNLGLYIGVQYLEYIESTGIQYIDTGIIQSEYKQNLIIEMDVQFTELPNSSWTRPKSYVGGCDGNSNYFLPFCLRDSNKFSSNVGLGGTDIDPMDGDLNRHKVIVNTVNGTLKIDDQTFNYSSNVANIEKSIYLFIENGSDLNSIGKIRLYSCTFKDGNDNVIRDFIPVKDDTNHGALYDKVTQQIFYNSGEGDFICGPNKPYTRIQYLEGICNEQYIDLGIVPTPNLYYYGKFGFQSVISGSYEFFGARDTMGSGLLTYTTTSDNNMGIDFFRTSSERYVINNVNPVVNDIFVFDIQNKTMKISKNGSVIDTHTFTDDGTTTETLYLNGTHSTNAPTSGRGVGRIYAFKIWNNGTLVRDMIPVLDNEGTPCMYDQENDRLYYNDGTGEFIAGPKKQVPDDYDELEYIQSTGTQYIDTGWYLQNATDTFEINTTFTNNGTQSAQWKIICGSSLGGGDGNNQYYMFSFREVEGTTITTVNSDVSPLTPFTVTPGTPQTFKMYYNGNNETTVTNETTHDVAVISRSIDNRGTITNYLFAKHEPSGAVQLSATRMYSYNISVNGTMVHEFIPAKRISDNVVGLYDTVSQQFFTNAGTGSFVPGPEK